jgi:hypothetical protein
MLGVPASMEIIELLTLGRALQDPSSERKPRKAISEVVSADRFA